MTGPAAKAKNLWWPVVRVGGSEIHIIRRLIDEPRATDLSLNLIEVRPRRVNHVGALASSRDSVL